MPKSFPLEQKEAALELLAANRGDMLLTSLQTGIAESTLRYWRRRIQRLADLVPATAASAPTTPVAGLDPFWGSSALYVEEKQRSCLH